MKPSRAKRSPVSAQTRLVELSARLAEAESTLRAIRSGEVDALVVTGKHGDQVFTLAGEEQAYRTLIESMNEGALTLSAKMTILYANDCFARMVRSPLGKVVSSPFLNFLSAKDRPALRKLLKRGAHSGSKIQVLLNSADGSKRPAQISVRPLTKHGTRQATLGMVVTDMTEARRNEELLRALSNRLIQAQEAERGRVALELHDNITQLLCAVLFRSQALAGRISASDGPSKKEAMILSKMVGKTADEVERISRNLRPMVLDQLGLVAVVRDAGTKFADRTGMSVEFTDMQMTTRLPIDTKLALYRILQEALRNVEKHSHARHVIVYLRQQGSFVQLAISDDGVGFNPDHQGVGRRGKRGLGLLGMRERAAYVGGALKIKSGLRAGTEIEVRIPLFTVATISPNRKTHRDTPNPGALESR